MFYNRFRNLLCLRLWNVDSLGAGANLSGVDQRGIGHSLCSQLRVGIFGNDGRILAA